VLLYQHNDLIPSNQILTECNPNDRIRYQGIWSLYIIDWDSDIFNFNWDSVSRIYIVLKVQAPAAVQPNVPRALLVADSCYINTMTESLATKSLDNAIPMSESLIETSGHFYCS